MNIHSVVEEVSYLAPYILMTGSLLQPEQAFLVIDKINEVINFEDIPFILTSAYFVFNIKYPVGCNNFYSFLEILLYQFPTKKALISAFTHVSVFLI